MLNDFSIITNIKEGDVKAFEQVFRLYYTPLCLYSASITGQMDAAEEIVQELFYVFWKERETLQIYYSIKSYLYGAIRNQSLQYCEHEEVKQRYNELFANASNEDESTPEDEMEYKELEIVIENTLHKLPRRCAQIFHMQRFEGKKYAEIANILSISIKTVEAEMTKALKALRKNIENYYNENR
ncbi:MAG: RNA polymerase sigma-70 factor [Bacteroidaceae bacterium]|nr:RNA polymerase sigma-70 factor [Bacteroidaceae bacterium]MDD4760650.1 RNA polymerase sigma-70 factor [Bacteroidaceae bacterium]